jgi:hypothetical protein
VNLPGRHRAAELAASGANGAKAGIYEDNGTVRQIHAW